MKAAAASALACAVWLAGCTTPKDIEAQGERMSITITTPVAVTYRQLVTRMRECYSDGLYRIDADYFPDVNQARVSLVYPDASRTQATIRLDPVPAGTAMQVFYASHLRPEADTRQWREGAVEWAQGRDGKCINDPAKP